MPIDSNCQIPEYVFAFTFQMISIEVKMIGNALIWLSIEFVMRKKKQKE